MPWPWPPLHHVFRAFDDLAPEQARIEVSRMLDGYRKGLAAEAVLFGTIVAGLVGVLPCGVIAGAQIVRHGGVNPGLILVVVIACIAGYLAGSWRWQRVAAIVLKSRLAAGGDREWNVCARCRYSLDKLPHDQGRMVCPECGHVQIGADWRNTQIPRPRKKTGDIPARSDSSFDRTCGDS